jgi:tetratricopeptide (TPR) repeat protein
MMCVLNTLCSWLVRSGTLQDLEEGVEVAQRSVDLTPQNHPQRAWHVNSLAGTLGHKYGLTQDIEDLNRAIEIYRQGLSLASQDDPNRAYYLSNLAASLTKTLDHDPTIERVEEVVNLYLESLRSVTGPLRVRIESARLGGLIIGTAAEIFEQPADWEGAYFILDEGVKLLPQISPPSLSRDDQQHLLKKLSGLSALAASAALHAGVTPVEALQSLEAGRGIMAGWVINSQSDVSQLLREYPEVGAEYVELRDRISMVIGYSAVDLLHGGRSVNSVPQIPISVAVTNRLNDVERLVELEDEIRQDFPGFEQFQRPPDARQLMDLAELGPVIAINATTFRSDAFIVTYDDVRAIPLPALKWDVLNANMKMFYGMDSITDGDNEDLHERNAGLRRILKWLWDAVVHPVLQDLGCLQSSKPATLPRVWWVTSGLLGMAPFHAVGSNWAVQVITLLPMWCLRTSPLLKR